MLIVGDSIYLIVVTALFLCKYNRTLPLGVGKFYELLACQVPGSMLSSLHTFSHIILTEIFVDLS